MFQFPAYRLAATMCLSRDGRLPASRVSIRVPLDHRLFTAPRRISLFAASSSLPVCPWHPPYAPFFDLVLLMSLSFLLFSSLRYCFSLLFSFLSFAHNKNSWKDSRFLVSLLISLCVVCVCRKSDIFDIFIRNDPVFRDLPPSP